MALWCNGIDLTAGTEIEVIDWTKHGLQFTGARAEKNNKVRTEKPDLLVHHWSGAENGYKTIFKNLQAEKLGIHLFTDSDGVVYQFADLWTVACAHAGRVNFRSIGWEHQNKGLGKTGTKVVRGTAKMMGHGKQYDGLMFNAAQLNSIEDITRLICHSLGIPFRLPKDKNGELLLDYLSPREQKSYKGVAGHIHFSPKVCPGEQLLRELEMVEEDGEE